MSNLNPGGLTRVLNYVKTWVTGLLNDKANSSHSHTKSQITDFPTIPTKTSQLTNDSGYITSSGSCNYANSAGSAGSATTAETVSTSVAADSSKNLFYCSMADNDFCRINCGGSSNAGYLEIATADDGNEPIYVRQYTGVFSTVTRTLTLLDGSGNTQFPGTVSAPTFSGNLNGSCDYATSAGSCNYANSAGSSSIAIRDSGGSWISGRDNAVVKQTRHSTDDGNSWNPAVSVKTKSGNWTIGTVGYDKLQFSYDTDEDYNTGNNRNTVVELNPESGTIITSANIGSQSVNYANSAGSANDPNAVHKSGDETIGGVKTFNSDVYSTNSQHLWFRHLDGSNNGGMDGCLFLNYSNNAKNVYFNGASYYINGGYYNGRAENAQYTYWLRTSSHADHLLHTEWDGSYFWTYVTAGDGGYRPVRVERSNSSGWADSAGGVAWGNVSDRPWAVSQFTNDSGFITSWSLMYINGDRAHNAYRIVYGSFNNLNNISTGRCWVSFPSAFSSTPIVVMTIQNADGNYFYQISNTTTTGFIAEIWDGSGNRTGNGVAATYIAIGRS